MKLNQPALWSAALGAGILVTVALLPQAKGEMVYQSDSQPPAQTIRIDERSSMRQAIGASERAQATLENTEVRAQYPAQVVLPAQQPVVIQQPAMMQQQPQVQVGQPRTTEGTEVQNMSRSELLRRERVRAELKNEDLLQERMEELRLRDEQRRTNELFAPQQAAAQVGGAQAGVQQQASVMQVQTVGAPITQNPGQPVLAAPTGMTAGVQTVQTDQITTTRAAATTFGEGSDKTILYVQPSFGMSQMMVDVGTGYDVRPRFATGISLGVVSSENLSFEFGYTYSELGIALNNYNSYYMLAGAYPTPERVVMKRNLFDAGMKLHFLGFDSKIRPFLGGGASYGKSYINYDQAILNQIAAYPSYASQSLGQDYQLNSFQGFLSAGMDFRVNKSITVGAVGKYYTVLSSRDTSALNNAAIYGYPVLAPDADKQAVGGSLSKTSSYTLQGAVSFVF